MGHAIGRLGCFAAGCCFGKTTHFWGVNFTNPDGARECRNAAGSRTGADTIVRVRGGVGHFFLLTWMFKRKKFDGQIFGAYLFLYGIARFLLEFLRDDPGRGPFLAECSTEPADRYWPGADRRADLVLAADPERSLLAEPATRYWQVPSFDVLLDLVTPEF